MDGSEFEHLLALAQAHSLALCALLSTHPQPEQLRTAFATLCETAEARFDTANWLIYQNSLETFRRAIPSH